MSGKRSWLTVFAVLAAVVAPVPAGAATPTGYSTEFVNVDSAGVKGNGFARFPSVSVEAGVIAFDSSATNLVSGDVNQRMDVFVRYRGGPFTIRASVDSSGAEANNDSVRPSLDDYANFVAFESLATNLVSGDTNNARDIFVRDLYQNTTRRISVSSTGTQANGGSSAASISADGRYVAFVSLASNLVADDTNGVADIFVHDLQTGTTQRVSVATGGGQSDGASFQPSIGWGGQFVAYGSRATNLVANDTNLRDDVFLTDVSAGTTTRVSVATSGAQADGDSGSPSMGDNGHHVAFQSSATNLVSGDTNARSDIFVWTRISGVTTRVSVSTTGVEANGSSSTPAVSEAFCQWPCGSDYVAFSSTADNLVTGDTNFIADIFRHDLGSGETVRWNLAPDGSQASNGTIGGGQPAISKSGQRIAFVSDASNLVSGDGVLSQDVILRGP